MVILDTVIPYLKNIQKIFKSRYSAPEVNNRIVSRDSNYFVDMVLDWRRALGVALEFKTLRQWDKIVKTES